MAMIRRIGTATEKSELHLTIHSVRVHLDVPCTLKVVAKRGKHKSETAELRYHMRTGVVFFEQEIRLPVTLYKRGSSYQEKTIAFRLVRVVGSHYFKDGKGKVNLNEVANTGVSLYKEDVHLKESLDKDALVCISLSLSKCSGSPEPPAQALKQPVGSGLRVDPVRGVCRGGQGTPVTAGAATTSFSPETRGSNWSPTSAQTQGYSQWLQSGRERRNSAKTEEGSSPLSPPHSLTKASRPLEDSQKPFKSPLLKLIKVEESLYEDDHFRQKAASAGTSSSEAEAPDPVAEFRDESLLSDGEEEAKSVQERKRAFRLDLSKPECLLPQQCNRGKPVIIEETLGETLKTEGIPLTSMRTGQPNQHSKEKTLGAEEQRTGMAGVRERGSVCSGCTVQ